MSNSTKKAVLVFKILKTAFFYAISYYTSSNHVLAVNRAWCKKYRDKFIQAVLEAAGIRIIRQQATAHLATDLPAAWNNIQQFSSAPTPCIFVCNHISSFDFFLLPHLLKNADCFFVITAEILKVKLLRKQTQKTPTILVDNHSRHSRAQCIQQMQTVLESGQSVMVFPEGKSNPSLGKFTQGAFAVALKMQVPIFPIYIHYHQRQAFSPDAEVSHKKEMQRILSAEEKLLTAYFFNSIDSKNFAHAAEFRRHVHQMYMRWEEKLFA